MSQLVSPDKSDLQSEIEELTSVPIRKILNASLTEWAEANTPDEWMNAAENFNPKAVITSIRQLTSSVGEWYVEFHNNIISNVTKREGIASAQWVMNQYESSRIYDNVRRQIDNIESSLNDFDIVISKTALFIKENSGWRGFGKGVIIGLTDPVEAVLSFFGKGQDSRTAEELQHYLKKSINQVNECFDEFDSQLKASIVLVYDSRTKLAIEEIRVFAEQERRRKSQEEGRYNGRKNSSAPTSVGINPWTVILLITIVILLIIILSK